MVMDDRIVVIEEAAEGSYLAHALGQSIFTVADDVEALRQQGREMGRFPSAFGTLVAILADAPAP